MSKIRVKFELNKGRHGISVHRLADVAKETDKFLKMFAEDVKLNDGEWIADNFENGSLSYDIGFVGEANNYEMTIAQNALKQLTNIETTADGLNFGVRRETFLQFANIALPLQADEFVSVGVYDVKP